MVIGAMFSSVTLAIAPIAERNKIVLLSPTSSDVSLTNAGDYIFRIYPSDSYDGEFLANVAYEKLGAHKAAIVSMQASSTSAISQLFKKVFEGKGGTIVSDDIFNEGATDYRAILTKLKQQQQDIVFLPAALKESALFLRQAKELSMTPKILGISTLYDPKLIELAGDAAEGVLFSSPIFEPSSQSPEIVTFVEAYKSKHKAAPDILGAYGYDAVNVAVESLKFASSGQITSQSIKSGLYEIKGYKGVTGEMSFDSNGDVTKELKIMTVKGAKFTPFLL
jgi:branched-chain amino acid transport system substrate-binding protein